MPVKGVIGFICVLTGVIGYLAFDWVGVAVGPLTGLILVADRYMRKRRSGARPAGPPRFRPERRVPPRSAVRNDAGLEALLAKAHRLADTFHDAYGARNCCLDILRQTDKDDPLFMAAYELFMSTVGGGKNRASDEAGGQVSPPTRPESRTDSPADAEVISFPRRVSRP